MAETSETKRNREPKAPPDRIEESPAFRRGRLKTCSVIRIVIGKKRGLLCVPPRSVICRGLRGRRCCARTSCHYTI